MDIQDHLPGAPVPSASRPADSGGFPPRASSDGLGGSGSSSSHTPWAIASVLIVAIGVAGYLVDRLISMPAQVVGEAGEVLEDLGHWVGEGLAPQNRIEALVVRTVSETRQVSKLVVLTRTIPVMIRRSDERDALWGYLNLGTTEVTVRALKNRVQFYVPLDDFDRGNMHSDPGRVWIEVPRPRVDRDLIEVGVGPGDLEMETEVGWARLDRFSGKELRDQAMGALREEVVRAAVEDSVLVIAAQSFAERELLRLFSPLRRELRKENIDFEVHFVSDSSLSPPEVDLRDDVEGSVLRGGV